jgi:hypothetical protein
MESKLFEQILRENEVSNLTFENCFKKYIKSLLEGSKLILKYFGNGKIFESDRHKIQNQKTLIPLLKEKIQNIKDNKKLISSRTIKGEIKNIESRNEELISLVYNCQALNNGFHNSIEKDDTAKELHKLLIEGLYDLNDPTIKDYNDRASKLHKKKLLDLHTALSIVTERYFNNWNILDT